MIISWFDTKEVDALADQLVKELVHRVPPESVSAAGKKAESKKDRTREIVLRQAQDFANTHPLNIYKKAKLANRFKWALIEAGYPSAYVDDIAYEVAAAVATRRVKSA